jgi:Zn-finger nucleic acid-binding protein
MKRAGAAPVVDVCESCVAIWFDGGELRVLRPTGPLAFAKAKRGLGRARSCPRCDDFTLEPFVRARAPFFACGGCEGLLLVEASLRRLERGEADQDDAGKLETAVNAALLGVGAVMGDAEALAALATMVLRDQIDQLIEEDPATRLEPFTR